jgi:DNA-binding CsgD family transcriptional regulator
VPTLARGDAERLLHFLDEAESFGGPHPFAGEFLTQLGQLVPADWITYSECLGCSGDGAGLHFERSCDERFEGLVDWAAVKPVRDAEDPLRKHYRRSFSAAKLSDFVSRRELHSSRMYHLIMKPCGIEYSLGVRLPTQSAGWPKIFSLDRADRDFSERDRTLFDTLSPHLAHLHRASRSRRLLREALAAHESTRAAVVLLEGDAIAFATPAACGLLRRHFGKHRAELPEPVALWLKERRRVSAGEPLCVDAGDRALVVDFVDGALLLEERRRMPGLTRREREILNLVAEGKTNVEIAEQLWVSPATVRKHLENVYAKLGVHTRTAAAAFVRERRERP